MLEEIEYIVTQILPDNREKVMCFGHETFCCKEDMEKEAAWHEVTFEMVISSYGLKKEIPLCPEESILRCYTVTENWNIDYDEQDQDQMGRSVIGVTKWKKK